MLVFPVHGITLAAPVRVLSADVSDLGVGEAILDAVARSEPLRDDMDQILAEHTASLADLGVDDRAFVGYPSVGFRELKPALFDRLRRRPTLIGLEGWDPDKGHSWKTYDHEDITVSVDDPAALGRAARELIARIPGERSKATAGHTGVSFGYKTAWLAVRTDDTAAVSAALGRRDVANVSWEDGIEASYDETVFVSPPTRGWVLAVGVELLKHPPDTAALSAELAAEVQFFSTHRIVEAHQWERAENGELKRRFRYVGESGEAETVGEPTEIERSLELDWVIDTPGPPPDDAALPDEEGVMRVAAAWSIDPQELDVIATSAAQGLGGLLTPASESSG